MLSLPVHAARVFTHHRHLLLLSPKADTHFTVLRRVEGGVDLVGWLHTEMVYPPTILVLTGSDVAQLR